MAINLNNLIFSALFLALFTICINAQFQNETRKEELPQGVKENLAKSRIAKEKKDYEELIKRGEEALKLSEDLEKSFDENKTLSSQDRKKLERLEKLVKRIRSDLGGGDDRESLENDDNTPLSIATAFKYLQENTVKLVEELKKSTRYSVSAVAIQSTNFLLRIVKFVRIGK